jgi:hypothetical protein
LGKQTAKVLSGKKKVYKARSQTKTKRQPRTMQDMIFCERWVVHHDHLLAYEEAGFKKDSAGALRKLQAMRPFIEKMQVKVERRVVGDLAYERKDILDAMANIGLANIQDYYEEIRTIDPVTKWESRRMQLKPLTALTRAQAHAIDNVTIDSKTGRATYTIPDAKAKLKALEVVGVNTKALSQKKPGALHNHLHLTATAEQIGQLENAFKGVFGAVALREIVGLDEEDQQEDSD